jgi:G3E family GTPase
VPSTPPTWTRCWTRLTRPAARIDVIVIEASGLAEPEEMIRLILSSTNPRIVYGGLVHVVDAAEFIRTRARHPQIDRHLGVADLVVLNKTDRLADQERRNITGLLEKLGPGGPVVHASYVRVGPGGAGVGTPFWLASTGLLSSDFARRGYCQRARTVGASLAVDATCGLLP